jgi:hypothetical protein
MNESARFTDSRCASASAESSNIIDRYKRVDVLVISCLLTIGLLDAQALRDSAEHRSGVQEEVMWYCLFKYSHL